LGRREQIADRFRPFPEFSVREHQPGTAFEMDAKGDEREGIRASQEKRGRIRAVTAPPMGTFKAREFD
jgi:hypothetical protein